MESVVHLLINLGYWGMLASAFIAGSVFPFSSEAVMVGLLAAGLRPWPLVIYGTIGNVLGSLFNYGVGRMGKLEWIERYLHVKHESLDRATRFMGGRGAWMGFFAFLPVLGSAIAIVLGLMRANLLITTFSFALGKFMRYAALVFGAGLLLTGCSPQPPTSSTSQEARVTVTIEPLRFFTEQIGGDHISVQTMVPSSSSPETYDPTPRQMAQLAESQLYIKVGQIGFERTWMDRLTAQAPGMVVANASKGIRLLRTASGAEDPHTWMSCANARIMAANICEELTNVQPADSIFFRDNCRRLTLLIDSIEQRVTQTLAGKKGRAFLIYHPALTYFAHDNHLTQLCMEEEGREPSASQMKATIDEARRLQVKTIFTGRQFSNPATSVMASATGANEVEIDPLSHDWPAQMVSAAEKLR